MRSGQRRPDRSVRWIRACRLSHSTLAGDGSLAATTVITAYELYSGASRAGGRQRLDDFLETLLTLPVDVQSARRAGAIDPSLRRQGQPINPGDNLIARICLVRDLALVTRNVSRFRRVADLKVVTLADLSGQIGLFETREKTL